MLLEILGYQRLSDSMRITCDSAYCFIARAKLVIHLAVNIAVKLIVGFLVLRYGAKTVSHVSHVTDCGVKIGVDANPHRRCNGRAQTRGFKSKRALYRHTKYIGRNLHHFVALGTSARYSEPLQLFAAALFEQLLALAQSVSQPFNHCTIDMRSSVHIAKSNNGAFCLWPCVSGNV